MESSLSYRFWFILFLSIFEGSTALSIEEIQKNIDQYVQEGFNGVKFVEPKQSTNFTYDYHGRLISQWQKSSLSCIVEGKSRLRRLILERLDVPKGKPVEDLMDQISFPQNSQKTMSRICRMDRNPFATPGVVALDSRQSSSYGPFRSIDGSGNHPSDAGKTQSVYKRIVARNYDGMDCSLVDRGNPRLISNALAKACSQKMPGSGLSAMFMHFGAYLDHDFTFFMESTEFSHCCPASPTPETVENCRDVDVTSDPFYQMHGKTCLPFARTLSTEDSTTMMGHCYEHKNFVTAFLDASAVYGSDMATFTMVRETGSGRSHLLKTSKDSEERCEGVCDSFLTYLPSKTPDNKQPFAGDPRLGVQPGTTAWHIVFVRLHNMLAGLIRKNSLHDDEEIMFQLARKFVIALLQKIIYREFLPLIMSQSTLKKYKLQKGAPFVYDPTITPGIYHEFATAAYRFGHTLVNDDICKNIPLKTVFFTPEIMRRKGSSPSKIFQCALCRRTEAFDTCIVETLRNLLFAPRPHKVGEDLVVRNINRGRDHGLGDFNDYRRYFNLPEVTLANIDAIMRPGAGAALKNVYADVTNMDLFAAGIAERPVNSDKLGPVFTNILALQFQELKFGDKFFYENILTKRELAAIERTEMSDILCAVTCIKKNIQDQAMAQRSSKNRVSTCEARRGRKNYGSTIFGYLENWKWR